MRNTLKLATIALACAAVVACDDNSSTDSPATDAQFDVTVTNLTYAQPLSPVAVLLHQSGYRSFVDGESASLAIEQLAEGGDNSALLTDAQAAPQHVATASTSGPVPPGTQSTVVSLDVPTAFLPDLQLSVVTMLVHTNDGITGTNALDVSGMAVGDSRLVTGPTWDTGTEANTETQATMPGPDFGGEGFSAARDDISDRVRIHQGIVSNASAEFGLASSDLAERHRFLNPTARIHITRTR